MRLHKVLGSVGIVAAVALGTGVAQASTPSSGTEHFVGIQTSASNTATVVALGPLAATGHVVDFSNAQSRFDFAHGTLVVRHHMTSQHDRFDQKTCVFTLDEKGTWAIVSGTGAYAHAKGSGTYTNTGGGQGNQACRKNAPPKTYAFIVEATGPVSL